jgi:hypothetical protein
LAASEYRELMELDKMVGFWRVDSNISLVG